MQAPGTWQSLIRLAANTANLVTKTEERQSLLALALEEPDLAPLQAALDADGSLQKAASSVVVAACNRMASGSIPSLPVPLGVSFFSAAFLFQASCLPLPLLAFIWHPGVLVVLYMLFFAPFKASRLAYHLWWPSRFALQL
jgi:hypothetical protein